MGEEIFTVKVEGKGLFVFLVIVTCTSRSYCGADDTSAHITPVDTRRNVLRRGMAFPLILGAEAGGAAVAAEGTGEGACVTAVDVFLEQGRGW